MMIPRDLPKAGQLVAAIVTDTALPGMDREMPSHFPSDSMSVGKIGNMLEIIFTPLHDVFAFLTHHLRTLSRKDANHSSWPSSNTRLAGSYSMGNRLDVCGKIENEGGKDLPSSCNECR
jgi:hypothetical protein